VYVKEFFGRLTQWQYKNIIKRVDELIPVIPVALNLARATKDVKAPPQPTLLFFAKIDHGECCLCNDYSATGEAVRRQPIPTTVCVCVSASSLFLLCLLAASLPPRPTAVVLSCSQASRSTACRWPSRRSAATRWPRSFLTA